MRAKRKKKDGKRRWRENAERARDALCTREATLPRDGHAGFDFCDRFLDELNGTLAMSAFVMLSILQRGARLAQMHKCILHVRLTRLHRRKTHEGTSPHENQTFLQYFHVSRVTRLPLPVKAGLATGSGLRN